MKIISLISTLTLLSLTLQAEEVNIKKEGVPYIKMLGKELKTNLITKMKEDPSGLSAMGFCTGKAEELTQEINAKLPKGTSVRRTALKTRSTKNAPDEVDISVMNAYQEKALAKTLDPKDIVVVGKDDTHRIYKPLIIADACLKCHGDADKISPQIKSVIDKNYPKDLATGVKKGDFRGVIVSEIMK